MINFKEWLRFISNKSDRTANAYYGVIAGDFVNRILAKARFHQSLLEVTDPSKAEEMIDFLMTDPEFSKRDEIGHRMYSCGLKSYAEYMNYVKTRPHEEIAVVNDIDAIKKDPNLSETVKQQLCLCRVGQGKYRSELFSVWHGRCAVTGCDAEKMLIASHIKPWRWANNEERLSPANGLLLAPHLDRAFDQGLITFASDDRFRIIISPSFRRPGAVAINSDMSLDTALVSEETREFLIFHNENIFLEGCEGRRTKKCS